MRNLSTYLDTPFDDKQISMAELAAFSTDHLERLIANDADGALTTRITATSLAVAALDDVFDDDTVRLAQRKARKVAKSNYRASLSLAAGKLYGAVIAEYGDGSPEVVECFPGGRTIFGTATDDQLDTYLTALVEGVTAYQATLGVPVVTKATDLRDAWLAVYAASETATGAKAATEAEKRLVREDLQWTLYQNLWAIADIYPRQPEKLALYMQPHLLGMPQDFGDGSGGGGGGGGGDSSSGPDPSSSSSSGPPMSSSSSSSGMPPSSSSSSGGPPSSSSSSGVGPSSSSSSSSSLP